MAKITVKETTELALELGYTLKKVRLGYTLIDGDKPVCSKRHLADMFSYLANESLERTIAKIKPRETTEYVELTDEQKYAEMDAFSAECDREATEKWNAYCEEVRQANEFIEAEGMSETYQKALSEVKITTRTVGEEYEHLKQNNPSLFAAMTKDYGNTDDDKTTNESEYIAMMDDLYTEEAIAELNRLGDMEKLPNEEILEADLIACKADKVTSPECEFADTSIYEDLSGEFYWDNVNNALADFVAEDTTCPECGGIGRVLGLGHQPQGCNHCGGTGEKAISMDDYDPGIEEEV